MSKWKFGVYLRLSSEDGDKIESNSITNQRSLIAFFIEDKKDIKIYKYYADDGYTGTDTNRPAFQEMLEDIVSGKINGVIVKDLSRLGRNYLEVGDFLDQIVPKYRLRFISINDNVDSLNNPNFMDSLEIPFKNLMNESYSYDTSKKIRSSFKTSKECGKFIGVFAPYGYLKDESNNHNFVVDTEAAEVVKKIFELVIKGKSRQEIVSKLNDSHILTPSKYFKERLKYNIANVSKVWNVKMLDDILKNETYIGSLIQGKRERISHKIHNIVRVAEDDWIIVKNHHKAIIKEKIFYHVQDILYNRNSKVNNKGTYNKYSGYLKCFDCKNNLYRFTKSNKDNVFYYCGTYIRNKNCSKHYITEKELDETILILLNRHLKMITNLVEKLRNEFSFSNVEYEKDLKNIKIVELDKEINKYEKLLNEVKNDYVCNYITKADFEDFNSSYLYELNRLRISREELLSNNISSVNIDLIRKMEKVGELQSINKSIVDEFIQNIFILDDGSVRFIFKYSDFYEELVNCIKCIGNYDIM